MKKLFFFLFAFVFVLSTVVTPVFAQGNNKTSTLSQDETIDGDYFAAGDTVSVLGTVNGDAYIAGGTVTFDGSVDGDVIAAGGTVTINGSAQNVRVAGGTVTINGAVEKNITAAGGTIIFGENAKINGSIVTAGGTITILAPVGKGAMIGGGTVTINNTINGDVTAGVGQLVLQPQARINGNLNYTSDQKVQILEGATITGKTNQKVPEERQKQQAQKQAFLGLGITALVIKLMSMLTLLILGLLLIFLAPNFVKRVANTIIERPWQSLGIGALTLLLAPFVAIILLMTIIGIPLAFLFIILFGLVLYFAKLFVIYMIGTKIGQTINPKLHMAWLFIIGLILYEVVVLIPIIGWFIELTAILFGTGSLLIQKKRLYTTLRKEKTI